MVINSYEHQQLVLDAKLDILEILKIGHRALYWVKDKEALQRNLLEIKEAYERM